MSRLDGALLQTRSKAEKSSTDGWAEKLEQLVSYCHPKQRAFVLDPAKRIAALVAGRAGKTTGACVRLLRKCMTKRKARCLFVAPTRPSAKRILWAKIKDVCEQLGIEARFFEAELICRLKNGSIIELVGADNAKSVDRLRGTAFDEVVIDEAAAFSPKLLSDLVYKVIEARLGDYKGTLLMISTPSTKNQKGVFYDVTAVGSKLSVIYDADGEDVEEQDSTYHWSLHQWSLQDNTTPAGRSAWEEALRTKERNGWSDEHPAWVTEYLGRWCLEDTDLVYKYRAVVEGADHNIWTPGARTSANPYGLPSGHGWTYLYGMDLGYGDDLALEVFAQTQTLKTLYHVHEYVSTGMSVRDIAILLLGDDLDPSRPVGLIGQTGWPIAFVLDSAHLGGLIIDELRKTYGIPCKAAQKKDKLSAIALHNGELIDGRIKLLPKSQLVAELETLQWLPDEYGRLRENPRQSNHCADAALYVCREALPNRVDTTQPERQTADQIRARRAEQRPVQQDEFFDLFDDYEGMFD